MNLEMFWSLKPALLAFPGSTLSMRSVARMGQGMSLFGLSAVRGTLSIMSYDGLNTVAYTSQYGGRLVGDWLFDDIVVTLSVNDWTRCGGTSRRARKAFTVHNIQLGDTDPAAFTRWLYKFSCANLFKRVYMY